MIYRNNKVKACLKEFRMFSKWASKGLYANKGSDIESQENYLLERLRRRRI